MNSLPLKVSLKIGLFSEVENKSVEPKTKKEGTFMSAEEREETFHAWRRFVNRFRSIERVVVLRGPLTILIVDKICRGEELNLIERLRVEQVLPFLQGKNGKLADLRERMQATLAV